MIHSRKKKLKYESTSNKGNGPSNETCARSPEVKVLGLEWGKKIWQNIFKRLIVKTCPTNGETGALRCCCWDCHLQARTRWHLSITPVPETASYGCPGTWAAQRRTWESMRVKSPSSPFQLRYLMFWLPRLPCYHMGTTSQQVVCKG